MLPDITNPLLSAAQKEFDLVKKDYELGEISEVSMNLATLKFLTTQSLIPDLTEDALLEINRRIAFIQKDLSTILELNKNNS